MQLIVSYLIMITIILTTVQATKDLQLLNNSMVMLGTLAILQTITCHKYKLNLYLTKIKLNHFSIVIINP